MFPRAKNSIPALEGKSKNMGEGRSIYIVSQSSCPVAGAGTGWKAVMSDGLNQ